MHEIDRTSLCHCMYSVYIGVDRDQPLCTLLLLLNANFSIRIYLRTEFRSYTNIKFTNCNSNFGQKIHLVLACAHDFVDFVENLNRINFNRIEQLQLPSPV